MPPEPRSSLSLREVHDALMAHITGRASGQQPPPDAAPELALLVDGDPRASAAQRVHVYAHMYRSRMVEALASQFPRLARWLDAAHDGGFAALTEAYVADQPSRHPSLRFIGQALPDWLARQPPDRAWPAALADLARLEWARTDVFDAVDQTPLRLDAVRAWPADRFGEIPLRLIEAHRRLQVAHPVAALWDAIGPGDSATSGDATYDGGAIAAAVASGTGSEALLVWRQETSVFHRVTDAAETAALERIAAGTTFGAICETLYRDDAEAEATAQAFAWLSSWASDELLVAP
jgi:hypothetical protein